MGAPGAPALAQTAAPRRPAHRERSRPGPAFGYRLPGSGRTSTTTRPPDSREQGRQALGAWRAELAANIFDADVFFQHLLRRLLGPRYAEAEPRLRGLAERASPALDGLVQESSRDEHLPVLRRHDALGHAVEEVVFHPSYHEVGRVFWGSGVLADLRTPGNEILCGALAYLLDQHGEAGHACPVACTAGAIKLIQRVGSEEQRQRYLPRLLERDYDRRLHAAQFVTEVQGGSDVGSNACVAVPEPGRPGLYRLSGEKWFCSVADAGLFVVSARPEGAPAGTRGLGLFLVPRSLDGRPNGFALRRLKTKLGTRSMATGEFVFEAALGELVGPLEHGFRNLVGIVLDTSRVHNALAAAGIMRRAFAEARAFARHRRAFERPVLGFPAVQETLARMRLRGMAALASTFRLLATSDRLDTGRGGERLAGARRIGVMVNKYWTSLACTASVRDGIEVLGGNGTIEDFSPLPRLYRDAIVIESWEGTHNTLCAQVLRDLAARGLHQDWLDVMREEVAELKHPATSSEAATAALLLGELEERLRRLLSADAATASNSVRHVVDRMCRLTDWVSLAAQRRWEAEQGLETPTAAALELYRMLWLDRVDPESSERLPELHAHLAAEP